MRSGWGAARGDLAVLQGGQWGGPERGLVSDSASRRIYPGYQRSLDI